MHPSFQVSDDLLGVVVRIHCDVVGDRSQPLQRVIEQRSAPDLEERLGYAVGEGREPRAPSGGEGNPGD